MLTRFEGEDILGGLPTESACFKKGGKGSIQSSIFALRFAGFLRLMGEMKMLPIVVLSVCLGLLIAQSIMDYSRLPDLIASHFDGEGRPNGWMSKSSFTGFMLAMGIGLPAVVVTLLYLIRFLPPQYLNVPHSKWWREPSRYREACDFLFRSSLWFASALLLWQAVFAHQIVMANQRNVPHLDSNQVVWVTLPLVVCTFGWVFAIIWRFNQIPQSSDRASQ